MIINMDSNKIKIISTHITWCGTSIWTETSINFVSLGKHVNNTRNANLKYNQDDLGMTKHRAVSKNKDLLFRMGRNEGTVIFILFRFEDLISFSSSAALHHSSMWNPLSMILFTLLLKLQKLREYKLKLIKKQEKLWPTIT